MKRIKLFENFEVLNPKEVMEDIKSIIYELEEYGFDISLGYYIWNSSYNGSKSGQKLDSRNGFWSKSDEVDARYIIIDIDNYDENTPSYHQDGLKLKTFMNQLKSHLDYINPKKIMDRGISQSQRGKKRFYIYLK